MKKKRFRFAVLMNGDFDADIEYLPIEEINRDVTNADFKTFTAAKKWLEGRWQSDVDHLRSNLSALKTLRRAHVTRRKA